MNGGGRVFATFARFVALCRAFGEATRAVCPCGLDVSLHDGSEVHGARLESHDAHVTGDLTRMHLPVCYLYK